MDKAYCLFPLTDAQNQRIREAMSGAEVCFISPKEFTREMALAADIILGSPSVRLLEGTKNLKWLQLSSAGADGYCREGALPEDTILTNATGAYGPAISEYMLATSLMLMKKLHLYRDDHKMGLWKDEGSVTGMRNANVLVLGMGDIGGEFAKKAAALGANVTGICRTNRKKPDYVQKITTLAELDSLLPEADLVAMSLPNTPETRGVMNAQRLQSMKKGAILVNVGRGTAVDTDALCDVLESGHLGGAALDVTDPEPLPEGHRIYGITNALVTPHISGGTRLAYTGERITDIFVENAIRYYKGETLRNLVNRQTGYMYSRD